MQKVKGELSSEDFDAGKATVAQDIAEAEAQFECGGCSDPHDGTTLGGNAAQHRGPSPVVA
jgi:hypothetical protein